MTHLRLVPGVVLVLLGSVAVLLSHSAVYADQATKNFSGSSAQGSLIVADSSTRGLAQTYVAARDEVSKDAARENTLPAGGNSEMSDRLTWFFGVGMVVNVALLVAFLVWAVRQWNRT